MRRFFVPLFLIIELISACSDSSNSTANSNTATETTTSSEAPVMTYTILNALPHDKDSYTEGFLMHNGKLFESSGAPEGNDKTRSMVGIVDPATGAITVKAELDRKIYFGEGITILGDKLYQLTWTNKKGFIYDLKTFKKTGEFSFPSKEGWGLTTDGSSLIMSDGSSNLTFLDPL